MSRRGLQATVALVVLLIGGWLVVRWWVSPQRQVNRRIKEIQKLVSKSPGESDLVALGKARRISEMFADNFAQFADGVSEEVKAAGPAMVGA